MSRARAVALLGLVACASRESAAPAPSAASDGAPVWSRDDDLLSEDAVLLVDADRIPLPTLRAFATKLSEVLRGVRAVHARTGDVPGSFVVRGPAFGELEHAPVLVRVGLGDPSLRAFGALRPGGPRPVGVVRIGDDELFAPGRPETVRAPTRAAFDRARGDHAVLLVLREPASQVGLRGDPLWSDVRRVRFTITLTHGEEADARLDVEAEGATAGSAFAARLVERIRRLSGTPLVETATRGLLGGVHVAPDAGDPGHVTATVHATRPQLTAVLNLGAALSGTGASLPDAIAP